VRLKAELLEFLRCPISKLQLDLTVDESKDGAIQSGWLVSRDGQNRHPIRGGIPRFVPESNYAASFGMQWNKFSATQLDSSSGHPISAERFWHATNWNRSELADRWVLDLGCGAGRFAEVALSAGAYVIAVDYSTAVDACYANLHQHPKLHVIQGDVYALPFAPESFDFVYSLGVLQHTPDVESAFLALPPVLKRGGRLCVDFYEKSLKSRLLPKYWFRPLTKRIEKRRLFTLLETLVPKLLPVSQLLGRVPVVGRQLRRIVPVANYSGMLPLDDKQLEEWALLDTFDWLSPEFDNPQTAATISEWLRIAGMEQIEVLKAGHLVGRGTKPRERDGTGFGNEILPRGKGGQSGIGRRD
jgi:SAM-dependent methyltransferase/uncharacterized protein YbaR (Trm112 family)